MPPSQPPPRPSLDTSGSRTTGTGRTLQAKGWSVSASWGHRGLPRILLGWVSWTSLSPCSHSRNFLAAGGQEEWSTGAGGPAAAGPEEASVKVAKRHLLLREDVAPDQLLLGLDVSP